MSFRSSKFHKRHIILKATSTSQAGSAFAEPSVTAREVERYEKLLTEQEAVLEYLEGTGIDSSDFDGLELPTSVSVVRERVEFLQKIGLTVQDISDYPLLIGCSVKKNLIPVLNYLESLNITTTLLPILLRKYPQILHSSVVMDLQPIVEYLVGLGIDPKQMGSVLARYPDVLGFKIEGTMSTSTSYLVMLGVNPRRMGAVLTEMPEILGMRVGNNIKPKIDFLRSFDIPSPAVAKMIENRPFLLGFELADQMRPAVDSLLEIGVSKNAIGRVLMQFPEILGLDVNAKLSEKLPWLTSQVGVSKENIGQVVEKLPQVLVINVSMGSARVDYLRQVGFSAEDVGSMVTKCPQLLAASIEQTLKPNLEFLVGKMSRKPQEVVEFPAFLTSNLESRIRPRYEALSEKGKLCSLAWMLNCNDENFQQRLNIDYVEREDGPEDLDLPYVVAGQRQAELNEEDEYSEQENDEVESKRFG